MPVRDCPLAAVITLVLLGKLLEARAKRGPSAAIDPKSVPAHNNLGVYLVTKGQIRDGASSRNPSGIGCIRPSRTTNVRR